LGEMYWQRYRRPLLISETATVGSVRRRRKWLESSVAAVARLRARGVPLIGYTWWPMLAIVTWAYRQGTLAPEHYLKQMGLWNLEPATGMGLRRTRTPLADAYRQLVSGGCQAVGRLKQ
jgi:beta-glucosidase